MERRLYLSDVDKKIGGVCGGIGEYFSVDPTLIRLLWIVISVMSIGFPGILAYIIAWAVMPQRPKF